MTEVRIEVTANVRSSSYFVARAKGRCPQCRATTRLIALALPRGHEVLEWEGDAGAGAGAGADRWYAAERCAFLFHIDHLSESVRERLLRQWPFFRRSPAPAPDPADRGWSNHCEHCGGRFEDEELHCEFDGAFVPASPAAAREIRLLRIDAPLQAAAGGYAVEPEFFGFMPGS